MDSPTITAIILTLNEAETIENCLKSLSWCNELIVVDSGSTDQTIQIASNAGARVFSHVQDGQFLISEQRNWALNKLEIRTDWAVFMDADEESTEEFQQAVISQLATTSFSAFYAAPAFMYHGRWLKRTSGFPNWHPRIVNTSSSNRFTGGVWEDFEQKANVGYITVPYVHRTNFKGLADWIEKHLRYADWESQKIIDVQLGVAVVDSRRQLLRRIKYSAGFLRPFLALFYLGIIRLGVLEGKEGRSYLRRMFIYELLTQEYIADKITISKGGEL